MSEQQLAKTNSVTTVPTSYFPTVEDWNFMVHLGAQALKSGLLPAGVKTPEGAAIIMLKGREMGIPFMVASAHIHPINGKPTMSAELMQAQARRHLPGIRIVPGEVTALKASVKFLRPEEGSEWFTSTFTIEDARTADLLRNPTWQKYPKAMLWSRAVSAGLRIICPEALAGVSYTPEEMGANVDSSGNVIETTGRNVDVPKTRTAAQEGIDMVLEKIGAPPIKPASNEPTRSFEEFL